MKPKKLKSGSWNVRVYTGKNDSGKSVVKSITGKTKKEVIEKALAEQAKQSGKDLRVSEAVEAFLESKKAVLSPTTYRSYLSIYVNNIKDSQISFMPVSYLSDAQVQKWVSALAKKHRPKTVKNILGLFTASISLFYPGMRFNVKLPQTDRPKLHTPTTAEIGTVLRIARERNRELYKAVLLGAVGMMRQGEIAALTAEDCDFERNTISVTKSLALSSTGEYVVKPPKNESSNRVVIMPKFVMDELPKKGKTVNMNTNSISVAFRKLIAKADVVPFRFHDLRHYAASIAASSSVGASVEAIKARGGWATDGMMKRIYINQIGDEVDKDTKAINLYFERHFSQ